MIDSCQCARKYLGRFLRKLVLRSRPHLLPTTSEVSSYINDISHVVEKVPFFHHSPRGFFSALKLVLWCHFIPPNPSGGQRANGVSYGRENHRLRWTMAAGAAAAQVTTAAAERKKRISEIPTVGVCFPLSLSLSHLSLGWGGLDNRRMTQQWRWPKFTKNSEKKDCTNGRNRHPLFFPLQLSNSREFFLESFRRFCMEMRRNAQNPYTKSGWFHSKLIKLYSNPFSRFDQLINIKLKVH